MFLWVRLVIITLEQCDNAHELKESTRELPADLNNA
jgi:hypothetical protein